VLSSGSQITDAEIHQAIFTAPTKNQNGILNRPLGDGFTLLQAGAEVAQRCRHKVLEEAHGDRSEVAKLADLPSNQTSAN
jgi:hypothetical protein